MACIRDKIGCCQNAALVVTADNEYKENNYHVARCISELESLNLKVDIFDLDKQPVRLLLDYDVVEFIGGNPYYLMNSIREHNSTEVLKDIAINLEVVKMEILSYAKNNIAAFERGGVSSNEIYIFDYDGKKYISKKPLMVGDNLSPFWKMMKNVFLFTFEKQNEHLSDLYSVLKGNTHIPVAAFVAADNEVMIYEYMQGESWDGDEFPKGIDNAYKLGKYIGYNHQTSYKNCGIIGVEDVPDFYSRVLFQIEECIKEHWNSDDGIDKKVREYFEELKENQFVSSKYSLMMVDMCADQFLFENENIISCVDLDAYVIGPVEWELSFLKTQVEDWKSFKEGYETYQSMPEFEETSKLFYFLMALNAHWDKQEMEELIDKKL